MRAMLLDRPGAPLRAAEVEMPEPGPGQVRLRVHACGVCRTDLHLRDGEVAAGHLPLILGHQIVGTTDDGRRVGVPWLGWTDGDVRVLPLRPREPVRRGALHRQGHRRWLRRVRRRRRALRLRAPGAMTDLEVAPLLCGGLIGHRALRLAGDGERLGLYGFGSSAHIICQVAAHEGRRVFAFTRARTTPRRRSRAASAPSGPATRWRRGPSRSTRRSSSPPPARSCRRRCARRRRAASSCAPAST